ncbi:MAG: radical SAM protein [Deltaproteobacteria bacterium]|nr:radical SAM protein [Deltaproteobacteria bacterium]
MSATLAIVTPPVVKPSEPNLSGAAAARVLRGHGVRAFWVDASIGWYRHALGRASLERCLAAAAGRPAGEVLAFRRALRSVTQAAPPLRRPETYLDWQRYSSAVTHLDAALALASVPHPGFRLRVADVEHRGSRPESAAALLRLARGATPFDAYFTDELIPALRARGATHVGLSLTFQNQAYAAFRLARLLRERLPDLALLLGGPLPACWVAAGLRLDHEAFGLFDRIVPGDTDAALQALARELGGAAGAAEGAAPGGPLAVGPGGPLSIDLDETDFGAYLAPLPKVPAALGRGCYWGRCTFCPDHLHPRHRPCGEDALEAFLRQVAARFPAGAMLHLTDSALPPRHLEHLADLIQRHALPLSWHGFVRAEGAFADPAFASHLAAGGCAMLQIGIESAAPRMLDLMGKGAGPEVMRRLLRATAAAGIRNQVYLLFGLPTETDADREATLAFVEEEGATISDINHALLNLPRRSPMHRWPERYGVTAIVPFHATTDLSLYDDFRCGGSHPRVEARRWLDRRFLKSAAVKRILGGLRAPFKANHACFL